MGAGHVSTVAALLLAVLAASFWQTDAQTLWPQFNRSGVPLTWELNPAENFTAMYFFRLNEDNETEFVDKWSKLEEPAEWIFKMIKCKLEKKRCRRHRKLRALQDTQEEGYIRIIFGDNEGPTIPDAAKSIFEQAAATWTNVITENRLLPASLLPNVAPGTPFNIGVGCGITSDTFTVETRTNPVEPPQLTILAQVTPIDGPGGVLAQAGPCIVGDDANQRTQSYLGRMSFDTPDFNAQLNEDAEALFNTVLHEMGHILGIGTLWRPDFLANPVFGLGAPDFSNQPTFTGANAIEANAQLTEIGASQVFVENSGGQGTADAHWEETVYTNELMTGFLNPGANPMSVLTIASLLDIGLAVNPCVAQSFGGFTPDSTECANSTFLGFNGTGTSPPGSGGGAQDLTPGEIAGIAIAGVVGLVIVGLACNSLWGLCGLSSSPPQGHSTGKPTEPQKPTQESTGANTGDGAPTEQQNQNINLF